MKQIVKAADMLAAVKEARNQGRSIGLVPTMGALHEGHLSLIERALCENDLVVVSLFVNPIQFNNKEDLEKYPRTLEADLKLIGTLEGADSKVIAFAPTVEEMYPADDGCATEGSKPAIPQKEYHFGPVEEVMEGPRRPGHFNGVAVVVRRLFDLSLPTRAYFGEKELVACPIVRADDGLALSSRNMRLSPEARAIAPTIYATLEQAAEMAEYEEVDDVKEWVLDTLATFHEINPQPGGLRFEPEYFEIVDARTLQPIAEWSEAGDLGAVGCIAVWLDGVRLIDIVKF